ncbi:hypothetical protein [Vibrio sp. SCSIO 43136]|uniref:hypothetical protein n=1 Tax=Vibrio sp. SCSIO 43136 TaxID=2819101 RepID=UPI00207663D5|nr:hypothetical protein [Vibrio sp. SCSIO 43136]USD67867.1 hypothetical protein J4N39_16925 [Vibrio sp. SCSIO 43136]
MKKLLFAVLTVFVSNPSYSQTLTSYLMSNEWQCIHENVRVYTETQLKFSANDNYILKARMKVSGVEHPIVYKLAGGWEVEEETNTLLRTIDSFTVFDEDLLDRELLAVIKQILTSDMEKKTHLTITIVNQDEYISSDKKYKNTCTKLAG